jgi:hypothetical protein
VPYIAINDDTVINQTGYPWIEFRFVLDGAARFDRERTAVGQESGFTIDPFTRFEYEDNDGSLIVSNGVIPPEPVGENVWFAGVGPGALYIRAADVEVGASFVLDEIPVIPLPPAIWAGLVTLAGMGAVSKLSRRRRLV